MLDVALNDFLEIQRLRTAMINRQRIHAERNLELRVLIQICDDDFRDAFAFEFDDEPAMFVRLVAHRADVGDDLVVDERSDLFFEPGTIDVEGNFRDDELLAVAFEFLRTDAAAQFHAALAGHEIILDALDAADDAAGREVRALDEFHQLRNRDPRLVNLRANAVNDFPEIVRRHVRGHADGDTCPSVNQQVRKGSGKNGG